MYDSLTKGLQIISITIVVSLVFCFCRKGYLTKSKGVAIVVIFTIFVSCVVREASRRLEISVYDFLSSSDSVVLYTGDEGRRFDCSSLFSATYGTVLKPGHMHMKNERIEVIGTLVFSSTYRKHIIDVVRFTSTPNDFNRVFCVKNQYYAFLGTSNFTRTFKYDFPQSVATEIINKI